MSLLDDHGGSKLSVCPKGCLAQALGLVRQLQVSLLDDHGGSKLSVCPEGCLAQALGLVRQPFPLRHDHARDSVWCC